MCYIAYIYNYAVTEFAFCDVINYSRLTVSAHLIEKFLIETVTSDKYLLKLDSNKGVTHFSSKCITVITVSMTV